MHPLAMHIRSPARGWRGFFASSSASAHASPGEPLRLPRGSRLSTAAPSLHLRRSPRGRRSLSASPVSSPSLSQPAPNAVALAPRASASADGLALSGSPWRRRPSLAPVRNRIPRGGKAGLTQACSTRAPPSELCPCSPSSCSPELPEMCPAARDSASSLGACRGRPQRCVAGSELSRGGARSQGRPLAFFDSATACLRGRLNAPSECLAGAAQGQVRAFSTAGADHGASSAAAEGESPSGEASEQASASPAAARGQPPILSRAMRQAFPYVIPVFQPLQALSALPASHRGVSPKSVELRSVSVRLAHVLMPPFAPATEDLWSLYTRRLLCESADASSASGREAEERAERKTERGRKGGVQLSVDLGLQISRLLSSRNVVLSEAWRALFASLDPLLDELRQREGTSAAAGRAMVSSEAGKQADGAEAQRNEGGAGARDTKENKFEDVLVKLCEAANLVRHEWTWGIEQLMNYSRRQMPLLEAPQAARLLHVLASSPSTDQTVVARLAEAFVFLWEGDLTANIEPAPAMQLLETLAMKKAVERDFVRELSRRLHCYLHLGLLTPFEKTQLAVAYRQLELRHFTFFRHLAEEIVQQNSARQRLLALGRRELSADELQTSKQRQRRVRLSRLQQQINPAKRKKVETSPSSPSAALEKGVGEWRWIEYSLQGYTMGMGFQQDFAPSGTLLSDPVMPLVTREAFSELKRKGLRGAKLSAHAVSVGGANASAADEEKETFLRSEQPPSSGIKDFTVGQMAVIADSMLFLGFHHHSRFFSQVADVVQQRAIESGIVDTLDPQQCTSLMVFFAETRRQTQEDPDDCVRRLTERFVDALLCEVASPAHCLLFFKSLVKWSATKVAQPHCKRKRWKEWCNTYRPLAWLHAARPEHSADTRPLLLAVCKHLCKRVHCFSMKELTGMLRSIAYVDFREEAFFKVFVDYLKERLGDMHEEDIANVTQAFNRAKIEEPHLFSLMGKRYQHLQASVMAVKRRGVLVRRIG
ncbi:hypothetical protein BESB_058950 [Besnoitia besnoiti]|uniref:Uncharacterized protein n=1 Tax=Besnoitia besnoiti TaxID=94643 RepID=A0A2A9M949_BESBE|nr:hypothetical protein BESB_058950 [Besnoitia besnoiti]PFH35008.1 hypothetical protein BESB_058950 [Besnoitia besnoiti]